MAHPDDKKSPTPFFARFLEGGEFPKVKTDMKAGWRKPTVPDVDQLVTHKYPSDNDEGETS